MFVLLCRPLLFQPVRPYQFGLDVADEDTSNFQGRAEWVGDDGVTYGWYTVLLPDGFMYNYTYSSSAGMGYMVRKTISIFQVRLSDLFCITNNCIKKIVGKFIREPEY